MDIKFKTITSFDQINIGDVISWVSSHERRAGVTNHNMVTWALILNKSEDELRISWIDQSDNTAAWTTRLCRDSVDQKGTSNYDRSNFFTIVTSQL